MLSRTHGQTASPTTVGKEIANVVARLQRRAPASPRCALLAKMNGAVGNYNAHLAAYPASTGRPSRAAWSSSAWACLQPYTIQIEPHDCMAELFDAVARCQHHPDRLEPRRLGLHLAGLLQAEAEGRRGRLVDDAAQGQPDRLRERRGQLRPGQRAAAHLSQKLPISRWQRDLTDSTVLRNMGVALGYTVLAWTAWPRPGQAGAERGRAGRRPGRRLGGAGRAGPDRDAPPRPARTPTSS
jgi:adenylosuccinate lyase